MKNLSAIVAGVAVLPVLALSGSAFATSYSGQIEGGDIYQAKNQTQNGTFADSANATCGDVVKLRVRIHNPGPVTLNDVTVAASLPTGQATSFSSKVTVSASNANPATTTDTAGIKSDQAATLSYVAGSTEYFDPSGNELGALPDGITTASVTVPGGVGVSTQQLRYVQFEVKLNCPATPTTPVTPVTPAAPTVLPNTGAGNVVGIFASAAVLGTVASRLFLGRRLSRQN